MKSFFFLLGLSLSCAGPLTYRSFVLNNTKFAASVYKEVALQNQGNFLVSPLSAQLVLALSQSGAKDETAEEIQDAIKLSHSKGIIDCTMGGLLQNLNREHDYDLQTINKIYVNDHWNIKEDFLKESQIIYQAEIENIDFGKNAEAAAHINQWVQEATDDKIHNLIDSEILSNETRAVLLNALRFKANWTTPFQTFATVKQDFHSADTIKVDTMHVFEESFQFYEQPDLNATFLELPFVGEDVSMTIVLPEDGFGLDLLEDRIDEVLEAPHEKHRDMFNVALPKFKMETKIDFKTVLQNLGVKRAFEEGVADFSGIAGERGELFIDDVVQKTFVDVNEEGMEAAAATFVVKIVNRNAEAPREFIANRPFLFFVKVEDLVVFVGRVVLPYY